MFGEEPGDGVASGATVFECGFKLCDKVREGFHGYGDSRDSILSEHSCPSKSRSFGHVKESKGNHLVVGVIDFVINKEVEVYSVQPLGGLLVGSIKGFQCSDMEFGRF